MDLDFWAARVHRQTPSLQTARLTNSGNHSLIQDEVSDDVGAWFPCPFCYVEIEIPLLCVHLQEEHCFELRNAVCPICAANLGKDPLSHFTMQHAHSVKRRKKSGFWNHVPGNGNMVKGFRELSSFLGANPLAGPGSGNAPAHDPLLSSFLRNTPMKEPKDSGERMDSCIVATDSDDKSSKPCSSDVSQGLGHEERMQRAAFAQDLLLSTIF